MNDEKIARINELYHKSKREGLTEEEKKEQAVLRYEYIQAVKNNLRSTLDSVSIQEADGTITDLSKGRKDH
ncbi:MAG: DUF896 domain-containing protein [Lachnospiraceae bacterium]|nr:DUF896 domain-containing protein [Lachnospiraceae bacterium]